MIDREALPAGAQHCPNKQLHIQAMMRSETVWPLGKNAKLQHCRANSTHVVAHTHTCTPTTNPGACSSITHATLPVLAATADQVTRQDRPRTCLQMASTVSAAAAANLPLNVSLPSTMPSAPSSTRLATSAGKLPWKHRSGYC